jgi:hypothetical protein
VSWEGEVRDGCARETGSGKCGERGTYRLPERVGVDSGGASRRGHAQMGGFGVAVAVAKFVVAVWVWPVSVCEQQERIWEERSLGAFSIAQDLRRVL